MTSFVLISAITTFISSALSFFGIVSSWIIFKKAGRKGWESIIPVWNVYVLFKIAGKKGWFWALILIPILWIIVSLISWFTLRLGNINEYTSIYTIRNMINWILGLLALIIPLLAWITLPYGLTKKFRKSNWFYIGMLFLTPIFFGILAFSDAKYEGVEFNEKYSWKKWLLITLGISLVIGCCNAGIKYYQYKDFYNYFENLEYESDDKNIGVSDKINKEQKIIEDNLNNLDVNNNYLDVIGDNTICFYENGKININPEIDEDGNNINCYNKNGKKEGLRISFYGNGKKKTKSNYKNGKLNGEFVEYTYNGYIKLIRDYKDDKIINN